MKYRWLLLALILIGSLRIAATWQHFSATVDEPSHLGCGMEWWAEHKYTLEYHHAPLARIAMAFGPYMAGARSNGSQNTDEAGNAVLHGQGHYWRNLTLARAGILPFFWLACWAIWSFGRRLYGEWTGLAGAGVFSMLPSVLGHSGLATTDMAAVATFAWTLDRLHDWYTAPSRWGLAWIGLAFGLAVAAKFSNLMFVGLVVAFFIVLYRRGWPLLLSGLLALVVSSGTYRFVYDTRDIPIPQERPQEPLMNLVRPCVRVPFLGPIVRGVLEVQEHNKNGHMSQLMGKVNQFGDWRFFPVVFAVKTPLAVLALFFLGWRRRTWVPIALAMLLLASILPVRINLGVRHAMHVYVPLSVVAGWSLVHLARWLTVPLAAWLIVASALVHPNYIASFNEAARPDPAWFVADSDLDWGQDLPALVRLMDRRGISTCRLAYFGTAQQHRLYPGRFTDGIPDPVPSRGCVAVSIHKLEPRARQLMQNGDGDPWSWVRQVPELERAGRSIVVFMVP